MKQQDVRYHYRRIGVKSIVCRHFRTCSYTVGVFRELKFKVFMKNVLRNQRSGTAIRIKILSVQTFLAVLLASTAYAHDLHDQIIVVKRRIARLDGVLQWMSRTSANQGGRLSNGSWSEGWIGDNAITKAEDGCINLNFQSSVLLNLTNLRYDALDKRFMLLLQPAMSVESMAWHEPPHQQITWAAIESLPLAMQEKLRSEIETLVMVNCMYPDRYRELGNMVPWSATKNPSPSPDKQAEMSEMKVYCEMPDGRIIHNVTQDRQEDLDRFKYLLASIIAEIKRDSIASAAKFMGTLAHLIEDSTSPAHSSNLNLVVKELKERQHLPETPPWVGRVNHRGYPQNLHAAIEFTTPRFSLEGRPPMRVGNTVSDAATELLVRCYAIIDQNRADVVEMVRAVYFDDMPVIERLRLRAATQGAELLADAYFTALSLARK